jgi:hypothetical protein
MSATAHASLHIGLLAKKNEGEVAECNSSGAMTTWSKSAIEIPRDACIPCVDH